MMERLKKQKEKEIMISFNYALNLPKTTKNKTLFLSILLGKIENLRNKHITKILSNTKEINSKVDDLYISNIENLRNNKRDSAKKELIYFNSFDSFSKRTLHHKRFNLNDLEQRFKNINLVYGD